MTSRVNGHEVMLPAYWTLPRQVPERACLPPPHAAMEPFMHPDPQTSATDALFDADDDAQWADLLSPTRRRLIASAGLAALAS
ncbi:hypothetical protein predicted by Glimmer/Critica [Stenotrophomonas maltophilia RA8]|nr:hypothetical protein predicted by Glimmer/Critica [Stenotrophomonas maltophilia RA8]